MRNSISYLQFLLLVAAFSSLCECVENSNSDGDSDDESNGALVTVETEDDDVYEDTDVKADFMSDTAGMFKPSKEWQTIKPGQIIPKGLHVRLNLQTGQREAKILDDADGPQQTGERREPTRQERMKMALEDAMKEFESGGTSSNAEAEEMKYWNKADKEGLANLKNKHFTREQLKQALKKLKVSKDDLKKPSDSGKKFRSIEDIRKDFKNLQMDMKTDLELLTQTLERYREQDLSLERRLAVLTDLEYYLHQIDNAKNFADMGGFSLIVADLNSTVVEVRSAAALVVSSAVQSNPSVQVSAIEAGAMQQLIRMLSTDPELSVRGHSMAALSSLLRHFPFAQHKFVDLGGLQALSDVLARHDVTAGTEKLCVKSVTLVNDLLHERISVQNEAASSDKVHQERFRQYAQVPLLDSIVEHGWCRLVPKLLSLAEHDYREKILGLMSTLGARCRTEFSHYLATLESLKREYIGLSGQEKKDQSSDDDGIQYFSDLLHTINNVIGDLTGVVKEEL